MWNLLHFKNVLFSCEVIVSSRQCVYVYLYIILIAFLILFLIYFLCRLNREALISPSFIHCFLRTGSVLLLPIYNQNIVLATIQNTELTVSLKYNNHFNWSPLHTMPVTSDTFWLLNHLFHTKTLLAHFCRLFLKFDIEMVLLLLLIKNLNAPIFFFRRFIINNFATEFSSWAGCGRVVKVVDF